METKKTNKMFEVIRASLCNESDNSSVDQAISEEMTNHAVFMHRAFIQRNLPIAEELRRK